MDRKPNDDEVDRRVSWVFGRRPARAGSAGTGRREIAALFVLAALAIGAFGLQLGMPGAPDGSAGSPAAGSGASAADTVSPSGASSSGGADETAAAPTSAGTPILATAFPDASTEAPATAGASTAAASTPAAGDSTWWQAIAVRASPTAYSGGTAWAEVVTHGPTQCTLIVAFGADLQADYGGFGAPTDAPRRRTFDVPEAFVGTARPQITCWRDGWPNGPTHGWTLSIVVRAAPPPTSSASPTSTASPAPDPTLATAPPDAPEPTAPPPALPATDAPSTPTAGTPASLPGG